MFGLKELGMGIPFWRKVFLSYTKHMNRTHPPRTKVFVDGRGKHAVKRERMRVRL